MFSCIFVHILTYYLYVFCRENGGGGVMDLVYGSSSSFYMDGEVKIVCECYRFTYIGFVSPSAPASTRSSLTSSYMDVHSTVQPPSGLVLDDYLSYSLFLVSSAHYILLFIAWCAYGGRGGLWFHCARRRVNVLRLFQSLLLIILLPAPP